MSVKRQDLDGAHPFEARHPVEEGRRDVERRRRAGRKAPQHLVALQLHARQIGLQGQALGYLVEDGVPRHAQEVDVEVDGDRQKEDQQDQDDLDLGGVAAERRIPHRAIPARRRYQSTDASPTKRARSAAPPRKTPYGSFDFQP